MVEGLLKKLADGPDPQGARVSLARLYRAEGRIDEAGRSCRPSSLATRRTSGR